MTITPCRAISPDETETDPDLLAARIVDTLLRGIGLSVTRRSAGYIEVFRIVDAISFVHV